MSPKNELRLPPTDLINPFVVPGPELTSFSIPLVSETLSQQSTPSSCNTGDLQAVRTTGMIQPVAKSGPVFLSDPPSVLSRACKKTRDPRATHLPTTIDAVDLLPERPPLTTLATSSVYVVEKPGPVCLPAAPPVLSRASVARRDSSKPTYTVTAYDPVLLGGNYSSSEGEPETHNERVDAAKVGWIIAIIAACMMTCFGIWLILRNFSARKIRRAAGVRHSQGTEMLRSAPR